METPIFNQEPTRMMTRSVLAEIPTRLGRLSMTDPNNGNAYTYCRQIILIGLKFGNFSLFSIYSKIYIYM